MEFNSKMCQAREHKMSLSTPCLHSWNKHGEHLDGWTLLCFFFNMHRCRSERWITNGDHIKRSLHIFSGWETSWGTHQTAPWDPTKVETRKIDVRLKAHVLFPKTNNQAALGALTKWLKHSSKHSNETVNMKRLPWHEIGNHRPVTLNMLLPETPDMSHMSELDKWTLF